MTTSDEIPRRIRLDQNTPAELAIRAALHAVEAAGADVRLTDAVVLLGAALDSVADFVDGIEQRRYVAFAAPEPVVHPMVKGGPLDPDFLQPASLAAR